MCLDFPQVQSELFLSLDEILNCHPNEHGYFDQAGNHLDDQAPWETELGLLLAEIFNNNKDLCVHVKIRQVLLITRIKLFYQDNFYCMFVTIQCVD